MCIPSISNKNERNPQKKHGSEVRAYSRQQQHAMETWRSMYFNSAREKQFCKSRIFNSKIPIASTKDSSTISEKEAPSWRRIVAQRENLIPPFQSPSLCVEDPKMDRSSAFRPVSAWSSILRLVILLFFLWRYSFLWTLPSHKYLESKVSIGGEKNLVKLEPCCLEYFDIAPK